MRFSLLVAAFALMLSGAQGHEGAQAASALDRIEAIAAGSKCAAVDWKQRGYAPKAYVRGVALIFAKSLCQLDRSDVKVVAAAKGVAADGADLSDALTWYDSDFRALGMANDVDGVDTLRHAYALLIALGMREASGKYCVGRDRHANFSSADSAEAGPFQTSWGAHEYSRTLDELYERYQQNREDCLLEIFRKNVKCSAWDARNWGKPDEAGYGWQKFTKACPAFATEYAAVVMRTHGGSKGEFGPIRKKQTELRTECDVMLSDIQKLVQATPEICSLFKR